MTTQSNSIKTTALDSTSTALTIGDTATTINLGGSTNTLNITRILTSSVKQKIYYTNSATLTFTVNDFLTNGTFIMSLYSSANPSTANDLITVNLPTPTAQLDGCYFCFRKLRGQISNGSANWQFVTSPPSLLAGGASLTTGANPVSSNLSFNPGIQRIFVMGYAGSYYWTFA